MTDFAHDWSDHLDRGETILWEGAPTEQLFLFRLIDVFLIPFVLIWIWGPFLMFLGAKDAFTLFFSGVFVAVGLYFLIGRFLWDAWRRRGTRYALTDQRALIHHTRPGQQVREQPLHTALALSVKGKDRGALTFGDRAWFGSSGWAMSVWTGDDGSFTFRTIDDPQAVYKVARAAIQAR